MIVMLGVHVRETQYSRAEQFILLLCCSLLHFFCLNFTKDMRLGSKIRRHFENYGMLPG